MPTLGSENRFPLVRFLTDDPPSAAPAGQVHLYADTDLLLYQIDEDGIITPLGGGSGGDVATDDIWDAAGDIVVGTGANTATRLAAGTNGHVLTLAAGTPSWAAPSAGGGGLVLLEQHTASTSATLDFTSFISSTYDDYVFEVLGIRPATTATTLNLRVGTGGGPTYDSGSNYYHARHNETSQPVAGGTGGGPVTAMILSSACSSAAGGYGNVNGTWHLKNPQSTALMRYVYGNFAMHDGTYINIGISGGLYAATVGTALTAVQFYMSSGNITSGTIRVYGLEK